MNFTYSYENLQQICESHLVSNDFIEQTRQVNIYISVIIISIGLLGNSCGFIVCTQRKFRSKTTVLYMFCLLISDSFYLVTHFFKDTIKAYIEHFIYQIDFIHDECNLFNSDNIERSFNDHNMAIFFNIIDKNDFFCWSINFARYFLRFVSGYIIVAFTIQRTLAIRKPFLQKCLESKKYFLVVLLIIVILATLAAMWIPFLLHSTKFDSHNNINECYIREEFVDVYFLFTNIYILIVIIIPMIIICICNSISIITLYKTSKKRKILDELNLDKYTRATSVSHFSFLEKRFF